MRGSRSGRQAWREEDGSALVIAVLVSALMLLLGISVLATSGTEKLIAANDQWSEGAFQAAEAAVHEAIQRLTYDDNDNVVEETEIGGQFSFYSGGRDDSTPQPPELIGTAAAPGFSVGESTGYNADGYLFEFYRVTGTGIAPRNIAREVEVQVRMGPVAQ